MQLKEQEYLLTVAREGSLTAAAEKLFLTPSALTQALNRMEKELGTPLFHRDRNGCTLTEAGRVYADAAREMLRLQKEAQSKIYDLASCKNTSITIGFPPEHGAAMFTAIYPIFHEKYPDIAIHIRETSVRNQQQLIDRDELDLGFMTLLDSQKTRDAYIPLTREELLIALPETSPLAGLAREVPGNPYPELALSHLTGEAMAQMYGESTFFAWTDGIFRQQGVHPNVIFETSRHSTILRMVSAGFCFGMATDYHCRSGLPGIAWFCLPERPTWEVAVSYKKSRYLSLPQKYLISLAKEYWKQ